VLWVNVWYYVVHHHHTILKGKDTNTRAGLETNFWKHSPTRWVTCRRYSPAYSATPPITPPPSFSNQGKYKHKVNNYAVVIFFLHHVYLHLEQLYCNVTYSKSSFSKTISSFISVYDSVRYHSLIIVCNILPVLLIEHHFQLQTQ